jgi:hypothetical protein
VIELASPQPAKSSFARYHPGCQVGRGNLERQMTDRIVVLSRITGLKARKS